MDLTTLKAFFQTRIGSKTAAGSIYPLDITDCLDALADSVAVGDIGAGGSDTTPPYVTSSSATGIHTIRIVFSENVTLTTAGWSFSKGSALTISGVSGSGTTWDFTITETMTSGDTITRSYDSVSGATVDLSSNELVSFTSQPVTNSIGDTTAPTVYSKSVANATPSLIDVVFSESVNATTAGWSAKKNGSGWSITSISGSGTTWHFTMSGAAASGDTLLISYNSSTGSTTDLASNALVSFTDSSVTNNVSASYDSDAQAFFTAAGISDTTQKNAVNTLVLSLKAASIWSKMKVIYPFVGGTSSTHKWNLKNPVDSDAAFRATFGGTLVHSATGVKGDGSTGYANTHFHHGYWDLGADLLLDVTTLNDYSVGAYSRKTTSSASPGQVLFGSYTTSDGGIMIDFYNSGDIYVVTGPSAINISPYSGSWNKLFSVSRFSNIDFRFYSGSSEIGSDTTTEPGISGSGDFPLYLFCRNSSTSGTEKFFDDEITFFYGSDHLTHAEMTSMSTAIDNYNIALSRV